jgi:flavin reductase (DIM6/NTAB) family NADH-FMN oxidoreductase RutF
MEIRVTRGGGLRLVGDEDFTRFAVAVEPTAESCAADALRAIARLDGGDHVWVMPSKLKSMAPRSGEAEWEKGFAAMVDYAGRKGWVDRDGFIRAHITQVERQARPALEVPVNDFKQAMRNLAGGVAIVATGTSQERRGLTVSAVTSVSAEPPCLLVCINRSAEAHDFILANGRFSVNLLGVGHKELAMRFAGQTGVRGTARFEEGEWSDSDNALPVLDDSLCTMECELMSSHVVGSHSVVVGQVIGIANRTGGPLVNFQGEFQTVAAAARSTADTLTGMAP